MSHAPFVYREFHDFPRIVLVSVGESVLLLDCPFDPAADEYPDVYDVCVLPAGFEAPSGSWDSLASQAIRRLGQIPATRSLFDPSLRKTVETDGLLQLLAGD